MSQAEESSHPYGVALDAAINIIVGDRNMMGIESSEIRAGPATEGLVILADGRDNGRRFSIDTGVGNLSLISSGNLLDVPNGITIDGPESILMTETRWHLGYGFGHIIMRGETSDQQLIVPDRESFIRRDIMYIIYQSQRHIAESAQVSSYSVEVDNALANGPTATTANEPTPSWSETEHPIRVERDADGNQACVMLKLFNVFALVESAPPSCCTFACVPVGSLLFGVAVDLGVNPDCCQVRVTEAIGIARIPGDSKAYVKSLLSGDVSCIDFTPLGSNVHARVSDGSPPFGVIISLDYSHVWVTDDAIGIARNLN
jgi:hypothetical protein